MARPLRAALHDCLNRILLVVPAEPQGSQHVPTDGFHFYVSQDEFSPSIQFVDVTQGSSSESQKPRRLSFRTGHALLIPDNFFPRMSNHRKREGEREDITLPLPTEPRSAAGSFSDGAARPLGKGYSEIMQMVLSYAVAGKNSGNPTLSHSLDRIRLMPDVRQHLAGLAKEPLCLIQGYSTPGNAEALRQFIHHINESFPRIETVDLYDLPRLYVVLGFKTPCMRYHIADAAHLDHLFDDGAVDLVVQDFLLNCIPASRHEPLLKEASRLLKPGGLGIISFTSSEALELSSALSTAQLQAEHNFTWDSQAYDLAEMEKATASTVSLNYLVGKLVYHQATSEFIYVAAAGGRFEFFRSKDEMFSLFEKCGLHLLSFDISQGSDDHGLSCTRYRCILAKQSLPGT